MYYSPGSVSTFPFFIYDRAETQRFFFAVSCYSFNDKHAEKIDGGCDPQYRLESDHHT